MFFFVIGAKDSKNNIRWVYIQIHSQTKVEISFQICPEFFNEIALNEEMSNVFSFLFAKTTVCVYFLFYLYKVLVCPKDSI